MRFVRNCRRLKADRIQLQRLCSSELRDAERMMMKHVQEEYIVHELPSLSKRIPIVEKDGVLCVKTRLLNKDDFESFRWPMIVPSTSVLVKALIQQVHEDYGHPGVQFTLCKLRERYWILGGRRAIKSILNKCPRCRRYDARPLNVEPAALPLDRVTPT